MMKFLLGSAVLIILLLIGMFYYSFCKETADKLVREYIEKVDLN